MTQRAQKVHIELQNRGSEPGLHGRTSSTHSSSVRHFSQQHGPSSESVHDVHRPKASIRPVVHFLRLIMVRRPMSWTVNPEIAIRRLHGPIYHISVHISYMGGQSASVEACTDQCGLSWVRVRRFGVSVRVWINARAYDKNLMNWQISERLT